jgi:hypothetical protein
MMPWRGWFQRWIGDTFGEDKLKQLRQTVFFLEDDFYDLNTPNQSKKIPISKTDPTITAQYRHPAPGSQEAVHVPDDYKDEDPYDSGYFKRDTRRRYQFSELQNPENEKLKLEYMDQNDPNVQEAKEELQNALPESSPGNKGRFATGPSKFDPSGLRATMSVTWEETEKSLDKFMPDHVSFYGSFLVFPTWILICALTFKTLPLFSFDVIATYSHLGWKGGRGCQMVRGERLTCAIRRPL